METDSRKSFLLVGLGNPGRQYETTRHNLGFLALDEHLAGVSATSSDTAYKSFAANAKLESEIAAVQIGGKKIILAKPQTFMNLSGRAVQKILAYYKIDPSNMLVINDDLDLPLGKMRFSFDSGAAGHNGVQSIIDSIGTKKFTRLRIGIATEEILKKQNKIPAADFVLQKFSDQECAIVNELKPKIVDAINVFLSEGFEKAASQYNG